jgi:hypothetical protein
MEPTLIIRRLAGTTNQGGGLDSHTALRAATNGVTATALAEHQDTTRPTVYRALEPFCEAGLLADDDGFRLTDAGAALLDAYERAAEAVEPDALAFLAGSDNRPAVLRALADGPARKATLAAGDGASRPTVHRAIDAFEQRAWARREGGGWVATAAGLTALETFETLKTATEQAIAKGPFLERFGASDRLPLPALEGADLVEPTQEAPHAILDASIEAAGIHGEPIDRLRTLVPVFSASMFAEFEPLVDRDTTLEIVYTESVFRKLTHPRYIPYLAKAVLTPTVDVRVYPDTIDWGIGIYDETVMLAGADETGGRAGVVGQVPQLRTWATETFTERQEDSVSPSQRLVDWLRRWVGRTDGPFAHSTRSVPVNTDSN